ncbi:MAG: Druantia anti-phage system protein DruA [Acidimicrobiales bacterium]
MVQRAAWSFPVTAPLRYCGREFSHDELEIVRRLASTLSTRRAIADAVCDTLLWRRPDGRRKDMSARVALIAMERDGLVNLPAPLTTNANGRIARYEKAPPELGFAFPKTLSGLGAVELVVVSTKAQSRRWRGLVASYHYLGYTPFAGAQLRYLAESPSGTLGALGFAASAWKCAPRDVFIGWDEETRRARLHLVVGNARFLIVPHVRVKNLASHLLARAARRLCADWQAAYGYTPVLLETFVEAGRFSGASYKAANWVHVGQTKGRGKLDRYHEHAVPVKDVYLYPLRRDYRAILTAPS